MFRGPQKDVWRTYGARYERAPNSFNHDNPTVKKVSRGNIKNSINGNQLTKKRNLPVKRKLLLRGKRLHDKKIFTNTIVEYANTEIIKISTFDMSKFIKYLEIRGYSSIKSDDTSFLNFSK